MKIRLMQTNTNNYSWKQKKKRLTINTGITLPFTEIFIWELLLKGNVVDLPGFNFSSEIVKPIEK